MQTDVLIVGAGLAGLNCARILVRAGVSVMVLDAADAPGGRIRTDLHEGFRLDRGFQVLLSSYPEARRALEFRALRLKPFRPGALVQAEGARHVVGDPFRRPSDLLPTLRAPIGSLADKLRILALRHSVRSRSVAEIYRGPNSTTLERLRAAGFSELMIRRFFRPFFGGIFLESNLETSSRQFEFLFRQFSLGRAMLPALGMEEIPRQLADKLPPDALRMRVRVRSIREAAADASAGDRPGVVLESGEVLTARAVVCAVEGPEAARLAGGALRDPGSRAVTCVYFDAPRPPVRGPWLVLNGEGAGPINNLCVPSEVSSDYAPAGRSLVSATVLGVSGASDAELVQTVRAHAGSWFGRQVADWRFLRAYRIRHAQFVQTPGALDPATRSVRLGHGVFLAGDHREQSSIQGALSSGRRAAHAVSRWLHDTADTA